MNSHEHPVLSPFQPVVAPLSNGGYVGVFSTRDTRDRAVLRARVWSPRRRPLTRDEFDVNTSPAGPLGELPVLGPDFIVAPTSDGGFAVAWTFRDDRSTRILLRRFDAEGHPTTPERVAAAARPAVLGPLSAAFNNRGDLLLLWSEITPGNPTSRTNLQIRRFGPSLTRLGGSSDVHSSASGEFLQPFCGSVAASGSDWLVSWLAVKDDLASSAVFVRRFADH